MTWYIRPELIVMIKTNNTRSISGFLMPPRGLLSISSRPPFSAPGGSTQRNAIPVTRQNIERRSPIVDDKFMATTLTAIIIILEPIRTSAQVLIRSFLGVKAFRKYPQDATAQPDTYPPTVNPIVHSVDGAKRMA